MTEPNDFLQLAAERFSVRKFTGEPVRQADLDKILQAGHLAPTACNLQPQRILVLNTQQSMAKLRKCTHCHFDAPTALVVCYDKTLCWTRKFDGKSSGDIDAAIVTTHMLLEAASIGVGATWVMYFIPQAVREELELPENLEPTALLMMGYPAGDAAPYPGHLEFRAPEQIVAWEHF